MKNTQPTLCTVLLYTTTTRWIFNSALMIFFCFVIYILLLTSRLLDFIYSFFFEHVQHQFWIGKCRLVRNIIFSVKYKISEYKTLFFLKWREEGLELFWKSVILIVWVLYDWNRNPMNTWLKKPCTKLYIYIGSFLFAVFNFLLFFWRHRSKIE